MFRWGIIGTGFVARKFVLGLRASTEGQAVLVVGRTPAHTQSFGQTFGIARVSTDLTAALAAGGVDAIYIATPPTLHREQALACLAAGVPVLIEKPMAASVVDTAAIIAAARAAGVFAMEAMWTRFLPLMTDLRQRVRAGAIGEVRGFSGSFGLANLADPSDNQFNAALGGGALLHRGIYPIAMALDLLGPATLAGSSLRIGASGVDEDAALILRHDSGAVSTLRASLRATLTNDVVIDGTKGRLQIHAPIYRPYRATLYPAMPSKRTGKAPRFESQRESSAVQGMQQRLAVLLGPRGQALRSPYSGNGYHYQADAVMQAVRGGLTESPIMPLDTSLALAAIIETARLRAKP